MFKRAIWLGVGAAAGSVSTVWAQRKVKTQIDKVSQMATPQHVAGVARTKIDGVRSNVSAAVAEGRTTKRQTEQELKASVDDRWGRRSG